MDVNEEVIDEAIRKGANLIIAHHPPIFRPLKSILTDTPQGRMIEKCIKNDIAVYAAHTNLDVAPGGVNDMLATKLGLLDTEVVEPTYSEPLYKLVVFSPVTHADEIETSTWQKRVQVQSVIMQDVVLAHQGQGVYTSRRSRTVISVKLVKVKKSKRKKLKLLFPGPFEIKC